MSTSEHLIESMTVAMRSAKKTNQDLHERLGEIRSHYPEITYALNLVIRRHDIDDDMKQKCRDALVTMAKP